jgi:hypothetical protein
MSTLCALPLKTTELPQRAENPLGNRRVRLRAASERALPVMRILAGKHASCDMSERTREEAREMRGSERQRERERSAPRRNCHGQHLHQTLSNSSQYARTHAPVPHAYRQRPRDQDEPMSEPGAHTRRERWSEWVTFIGTMLHNGGCRVSPACTDCASPYAHLVRLAWEHDLV